MPIEYRRLTESELDTFIEMRINQLGKKAQRKTLICGPCLKIIIFATLRTELLFLGSRLTEKKLLEQAECLLWKSRRTSPAQAEKSDCFQACSQIPITEEKESQRNF